MAIKIIETYLRSIFIITRCNINMATSGKANRCSVH